MKTNTKDRAKTRYYTSSKYVRAGDRDEFFKYVRSKGYRGDTTVMHKISAYLKKRISDGLALGKAWKMPKGFGHITLLKYKREPLMLTDRYTGEEYFYPGGIIDWKSTLELYKENPELRNRNIYKYYDNEYIFGFVYTNRQVDILKYVKFYPNTTLKKRLSENIKDGKIDAYIYPKKFIKNGKFTHNRSIKVGADGRGTIN